jgi:hypothetical protein
MMLNFKQWQVDPNNYVNSDKWIPTTMSFQYVIRLILILDVCMSSS